MDTEAFREFKTGLTFLRDNYVTRALVHIKRASDLENTPSIKIEASGSGAMAEVAPRHAPIAGDFMLAIVALVILEGLIAYRRRRRVVTV